MIYQKKHWHKANYRLPTPLWEKTTPQSLIKSKKLERTGKSVRFFLHLSPHTGGLPSSVLLPQTETGP
jgi:hypothetical protein